MADAAPRRGNGSCPDGGRLLLAAGCLRGSLCRFRLLTKRAVAHESALAVSHACPSRRLARRRFRPLLPPPRLLCVHTPQRIWSSHTLCAPVSLPLPPFQSSLKSYSSLAIAHALRPVSLPTSFYEDTPLPNMSDDARSIHTRPQLPRRKRILVVSNASPENSEDEGPPPQKPYGYPRPLPSPSSSLPSAEQHYHDRHYSPGNNAHLPPPLTTNLPHYPSSRSNPSNPALSSPSSSSSPAVESTPPPSTPGLSGPSLHIPDEGTIRQDMITPATSDRNDSTPQASRPRAIFERIWSHVPNQVHERRYSSSGSRPATVCCGSSLPTHPCSLAHSPRSSPPPSHICRLAFAQVRWRRSSSSSPQMQRTCM